MVKAKGFWSFLCEKKDYRFFAGVACPGFSPLYKAMSSEFLHYIPACNESLALSIASGITMTGVKSGILISSCFLSGISLALERLSREYRIPVLVFVYLEDDTLFPKGIKSFSFDPDNFESLIEKAITTAERRMLPVIVSFKEGDLG